MASYDIEKDQTEADDGERSGSPDFKNAPLIKLTPVEQKKLIRRIDRRLVLTLGFLYGVSLMDRNNLGIAFVAGMGVDLSLTGTRYSVIILIFFVTYVILQPAMTVALRKVGPRIFIPTIALSWGIATIGFGFVKTWTTLVPLRLLLGILEAGFAPGCTYLLSCWYPRYDLQKRYAVFYLIGVVCSSFSGILGYGFSQMNGLGSGAGLGKHHSPPKLDPTAVVGEESGIAGWRWIFIMQGIITCTLALGSFLLLVDFPEKASSKSTLNLQFLNKDEAAFVVARIEEDRSDVMPPKFQLGQYLRNGLDVKILGFAAISTLITTNSYAIAYFLPIILSDGMGFGLAASECLITPPNLASAVFMYYWGYLGDKYHVRAPFLLINALLALIGLPLLGFAKSSAVRYFGVFLATIACNASLPCVVAYQANNVRGQWKRALSSATIVASGGIGGIIGGTVFRAQDKPRYLPGICATMIASVLIIIITCLLTLKFHRANKRADAGEEIIEGHKDFRYTL